MELLYKNSIFDLPSNISIMDFMDIFLANSKVEFRTTPLARAHIMVIHNNMES